MKRWGVINKTTKQLLFQSDRYGDCEFYVLQTASSLYAVIRLADFPDFIWQAEGITDLS